MDVALFVFLVYVGTVSTSDPCATHLYLVRSLCSSLLVYDPCGPQLYCAVLVVLTCLCSTYCPCAAAVGPSDDVVLEPGWPRTYMMVAALWMTSRAGFLLPLLAEALFTEPMVSCSVLVSAPPACHLCSPPCLEYRVQLSCGTPVSLLPL